MNEIREKCYFDLIYFFENNIIAFYQYCVIIKQLNNYSPRLIRFCLVELEEKNLIIKTAYGRQIFYMRKKLKER